MQVFLLVSLLISATTQAPQQRYNPFTRNYYATHVVSHPKITASQPPAIKQSVATQNIPEADLVPGPKQEETSSQNSFPKPRQVATPVQSFAPELGDQARRPRYNPFTKNYYSTYVASRPKIIVSQPPVIKQAAVATQNIPALNLEPAPKQESTLVQKSSPKLSSSLNSVPIPVKSDTPKFSPSEKQNQTPTQHSLPKLTSGSKQHPTPEQYSAPSNTSASQQVPTPTQYSTPILSAAPKQVLPPAQYSSPSLGSAPEQNLIPTQLSDLNAVHSHKQVLSTTQYAVPKIATAPKDVVVLSQESTLEQVSPKKSSSTPTLASVALKGPVPKIKTAPKISPIIQQSSKATFVPTYNPAPHYIPPSFSAEDSGYTYEYAVQDDYNNVNFGANENRKGYSTSGSYYVSLPDTRLQKVSYTVSRDGGYVADITYHGEAQYPNIETYPASDPFVKF